MVKFAPAVRSTAARTQELQSAPRRQPSAHQAPASSTVGLADSPLQGLQSLVDTSPRVMQLKGWQALSGGEQRRKYLEREIMVHENDLASLPHEEKRTDVERLTADKLTGEIERLKAELAEHTRRLAKA